MTIITVKNLKAKLDSGEAILIDVRESAEHNSEKIPGAEHIPLGKIDKDLLPKFAGDIVCHCQSGRRSMEACKKLLEQNPDLKIYSLEGGISAWRDAGHETERGSRNVIPIDRQTQIIAGLLILTGFSLGKLVDPSFYYLSGFVGAGLTFAGISGWCGMAKLLAIMPWNK